jgi:hypothetical protein
MATATIQVAYEAETSSLKATVNEINQINDKVVEGAQKAAKQSSDAFKKVGESITGAFAGENVKKALNNINTESLQLVKTLPKVSAEVIKLASTAADIGKLEEQLRDLALAGQTNTEEFDRIAKAVGQYKASITLADRAIEAYAKSTDAASSRIGILEDKLYDLAIAGKQDTKEFKDLIQETTRLKTAIFETDQQVDSFVEKGRGFNTLVQNVQLVGAAFQAVEGFSAALGVENEELQKTMTRLNAIMAISGSLEQIRSTLLEQSAKKTGVAAAAQAGYNVVVGTSTGLMKAFRIALAATGVGALVLGLVALIANFDKIKDSITGASVSSKALAATLEDTKTAIGGATAETQKVGTAFELAGKGVISKEAALIIYNETLGNSLGKTNDFNKAEQNFINKKGAYIEATAARAKAQALLAQAAVLAAEAAVVGEEDVRSTGEKILAFTKRAGAAFVDLQTGSIFNLTEAAKQSNNEDAKLAQQRVVNQKNAQVQIRQDLANSEFEKAAIIEKSAGILSAEEQQILDDAQAKKDAANEKAKAKAKEAADKQRDAEKKAAEDQAKAREQLLKLEEQAFIDSLDAQSKILNDNNNKIIELEKTFAAAKFKAGSEEAIEAEKQLATAIAEIRTQELTQLAVLDKAANEKLLKDKLDVAKAAEGATLQQQLAALEAQQTIELSFAETLGLSELEIATRYASQIAKVKSDIAAETIQNQINELQTLEITEGSSLERRIELIKIDAQKRIDAAKGNASEIALINAETEQAITAETEAETDKRIALAEKYAQAIGDLFGGINDLNKQLSENRIAEIEASSAAELEAINNNGGLERDQAKQREALSKRTAAAVAAERTKQARAEKALAIFDIGVNTAIAISKAIAASPLTGGLPFSALVAALGAAQLAAVIAKPIPKFERGGLIGGKLHTQGGTLIEAEQGEYMVNRRQTAKHRRELDAMNTSTEAFRRMIDERYVRPALMGYSAGRRGKEGVTVNASLNSKSMEKEMRAMRKDLKNRNVVVNINQQDQRYIWQ